MELVQVPKHIEARLVCEGRMRRAPRGPIRRRVTHGHATQYRGTRRVSKVRYERRDALYGGRGAYARVWPAGVQVVFVDVEVDHVILGGIIGGIAIGEEDRLERPRFVWIGRRKGVRKGRAGVVLRGLVPQRRTRRACRRTRALRFYIAR